MLKKLELLLCLPKYRTEEFKQSLLKKFFADLQPLGTQLQMYDLPLYDLQPNEETIKKIDLKSLDKYDSLIFVSKFGVQHFFKHLKENQMVLPFGKQYLSVGSSVSKVLLAHGIKEKQYFQASKKFSLKSLLEEYEEAHPGELSKQKIALFCSEANDLSDIEDWLSENKITLDRHFLYRQESSETNVELDEELTVFFNTEDSFEAGKCTLKMVCLTSPLSVELFSDFIKNKAVNLSEHIFLICLGEKTLAKAQKLFKKSKSYGNTAENSYGAMIDFLILSSKNYFLQYGH